MTKKIIIFINLILLSIVCLGCDEVSLSIELIPTSESIHSQQELQAIHEDKVKEFIIESAVKYSYYNENNNYVFSGLSFYSNIQMLKVLSSGEFKKVYEGVLKYDYSNIRDKYIYMSLDKQFDRNKLILTNNKYERELTGYLKINNSLFLNNDIDHSSISNIIDYYRANIYSKSTNGINEIIMSNQIDISNVWNDYIGSINLSDKEFEFKNSDGNITKRQFLTAGNVGSKFSFESFTGFMLKTEDEFNIYLLLPNEGKSLLEVFTVNNIKSLINHNYVNNPTDYTKCFFPDFEINSHLDINDFLSSVYEINDEDLKVTINQDNHLKIDRYGINSNEIEVSSEDLIYTGVNYNYLEDFIIDRPFGFIISYDNFPLFSGVVANL